MQAVIRCCKCRRRSVTDGAVLLCLLCLLRADGRVPAAQRDQCGQQDRQHKGDKGDDSRACLLPACLVENGWQEGGGWLLQLMCRINGCTK